MAKTYPSLIFKAMRSAFEIMTAERGWYQELGLTKTGAGSILNRYKKGTLSLDKIGELLEAKVVTVEIPEIENRGITESYHIVPIEDIDHTEVSDKQLKS